MNPNDTPPSSNNDVSQDISTATPTADQPAASQVDTGAPKMRNERPNRDGHRGGGGGGGHRRDHRGGSSGGGGGAGRHHGKDRHRSHGGDRDAQPFHPRPQRPAGPKPLDVENEEIPQSVAGG